MLNDKTVLVTGAAGFLGGHVVRGLLDRGYRVVGYDIADDKDFYTGWIAPVENLEYVQADLADAHRLGTVLAQSGATGVVHAAALLGSPVAGRERASADDYLRSNVQVTWQLCEIVRELPGRPRVVAVSSRSAYGEYAPEDGPISEDMAFHPVGFYGVSKAAADMGLRVYREKLDVDVVAARVTGMYGLLRTREAFDRFLESHTPPFWRFAGAAMREQEYRLDAGGDFLYEQTYVKDVVAGIVRLLEADRLSYAHYNLGNGEAYPLARIVDALRKEIPDSAISIGPGLLPNTPLRAAMSNDRITREVGYTPRWPLERGVGDLVRWWRTGTYGPSAFDEGPVE